MKSTAASFKDKWNFSHCVCAMDVKDVAIQKPGDSGSLYYNYKKFFSVVLFAVVSANYDFQYVKVGNNGSVSDSTALQNTTFYQKLVSHDLNLPCPSLLPGTNTSIPYIFVGDSAFALSKHIMKPYPLKNITHEQRIFNYRLSRARRVVENCFGILVARFGVFQSAISVNIKHVDVIILACCYLHNYLSKKKAEYISEYQGDPGECSERDTVERLRQTDMVLQSAEGTDIRQKFTNYFTNEGRVSFQEDMLRPIE